MITASNSSGKAVVQNFSGQADEQPDACGSFVRLTWDDNSKLAGIWDQVLFISKFQVLFISKNNCG